MLPHLMNLDRRAQFHAIVLAALAQVAGLVVVSLVTAGQPEPTSGGQFALAAVYTLLSSGMALHVAGRLQEARNARN